MNIKQLNSFLVLCDERHYGRAANRLFITQPSLSQQIKQLEISLKIILFKRKGRNIEITKAGIVLKQHALKIMDDLKNAENELRPYLHQQRESISVGVSGSHLILPVFENFSRHYPEISLTVKEYSSEQTVKKIVDNSLEMGIVYQTSLPSHLSSTLLFEDEIIAAIPMNHPLAKLDTLTLEHLNDQPLIVLNDALLLRSVINAELSKRMVVPNIICELDNHYSCLAYAEAEIGIALIARSLTNLTPPKNVRLVSLDVPAFYPSVILVHGKELQLDDPLLCLLSQIKTFHAQH